MTGDQFDEWLEAVRQASPGITNIEIASNLTRTDQWLSNSRSRGVKAFDALALRYYLTMLQRRCK